MESKKNEGNEFFRNKEFNNALERYKEAIELTEDNDDLSKLHSNISATLCKLENYDLALEHAIISTKLNLDWYKAWYRLSFVLFKLKKIDPAKKTINRTIECCKDQNINETYIFELRDDIYGKKVNENEEYKVIDDKNQNPFLNSNMNPLMAKMMGNEKLREKLSDPKFKEKMLKNKSNPLAMMSDPEMFGLMNEVMNFK